LREFGIEPLIYDPVAEAEVVHHEYGLELSPLSELKRLQGVVVAVAHQEIVSMGLNGLSQMVEPGGVVIDIKSIFSPKDVPGNLHYWSL
jgi:UDP-N-acetyl-D-galactosamine dehydrogenase